jgi:hypothetical protein
LPGQETPHLVAAFFDPDPAGLILRQPQAFGAGALGGHGEGRSEHGDQWQQRAAKRHSEAPLPVRSADYNRDIGVDKLAQWGTLVENVRRFDARCFNAGFGGIS